MEEYHATLTERRVYRQPENTITQAWAVWKDYIFFYFNQTWSSTSIGQDQRVIAAPDHFTSHPNVIFHSYHVFNTCPLPQWSLWLALLSWKRPTKLLEKPTLLQSPWEPALPIGHPVFRQHSHFPAQWSSTPWPLPRPPPQQSELQHQLQPREPAQATSTYLWAISHRAAPIRAPALAHLTRHSPCT